VPPIVRAAVVLAVLAVVARAAEFTSAPPRPLEVRPQLEHAEAAPAAGFRAECPPGTLPDARVCIPVPGADRVASGPELFGPDRIPRRPERLADYARYELPVAVSSASAVRPASSEPAAEAAPAAPTGIELRAAPGREVLAVELEGQSEGALVLHAGELLGTSVIALHTVRAATPDGARADEVVYLVLYAKLGKLAPGVSSGQVLEKGARVGVVGEAGGLHFEVRRARKGVELAELGLDELLHASKTLPVDPRNMLGLVKAP
jgi:hypothetical protein